MNTKTALVNQIGCIVLVCFCLFGCSSKNLDYDILVHPVTKFGDASADSARGHSYFLVSGLSDIDEVSVSFDQAKDWIRNALELEGLYEAEHREKADMYIAVHYGVGPVRVVERYNPGGFREERLHVQRDSKKREA